MSQQTFIRFFTTARFRAPAETLSKVLNLIDTTYIDATRYRGVDTSWDERNKEYDFPDYDFLMRRVSREEVAALYEQRKLLSIACGCTMLTQIRAAVEAEIPIAIRNDHVPHNTSVDLGLHDIFEDSEVAEGRLFGHATFSLAFWGYRTPLTIPDYRAAVMRLAIIQIVRQQLQDILGPVECSVYTQL